MAESLCFSPETITTLLIGYIPTQNKKLKKKKRKDKKKKKKINVLACHVKGKKYNENIYSNI